MKSLVALLPLGILALGAAACSGPQPSPYAPTGVPDAMTFGPVAQMLDVRCGTLDCHGSIGRNLRLYGSAGLRLSPADRPLSPACDTADETTQDYMSVVDLEPEVLSAVVAGGGQSPERLTLVRKARGTEHHKGGTIWAQGDPADVCLTAWLSGKSDPAACLAGVTEAVPDAGPQALLTCIMSP